MENAGLERTYGGRRIGLEPPTPEQLAHAAYVDELLRRIFQRPATVVALPSRRELKQAA